MFIFTNYWQAGWHEGLEDIFSDLYIIGPQNTTSPYAYNTFIAIKKTFKLIFVCLIISIFWQVVIAYVYITKAS